MFFFFFSKQWEDTDINKQEAVTVSDKNQTHCSYLKKYLLSGE